LWPFTFAPAPIVVTSLPSQRDSKRSADTTTTTTTNESYLWPFTSSSSSSDPAPSKPPRSSRRKANLHKETKETKDEEHTAPLIPFLPFPAMPGMGANISISSPGTSIVGYNPSTTTLSDVGMGGGRTIEGDKSSTANNSVVSKSSAFDFKGSPRRNNNDKMWPSELPGGEEWTPFTYSQKETEFAEHKAMPTTTSEDKTKEHLSSSGISHLLWRTNWVIEVLSNFCFFL